MAIKRSKTEIENDIIIWKAKLTDALETLDAINATANELNSFDDNEGSQRLRKRKITDQTEYVDYIEDKLQKLNIELQGRTTRITHVNRRNIGNGGVFI